MKTDKRALIWKKASQLITEFGFEAVSLRQLAEEVGVTPGSLYNHIQSKQELLYTLLRDVMAQLLQSFEKTVLPLENPLDQMRAFIRLHIAYHTDRRYEVRIATTELRSLENGNYKKIVALRDQYELHVRGIVERGCKAGDFSVLDISIATAALITMLTSTSYWYRENARLTKEQLIEQFTPLAFRLLGAYRGERNVTQLH